MTDQPTPPSEQPPFEDAGQPAVASPSAPPPAPKGRGRGLFWGLLGGCLGLFVLMTALGALAAVMGARQDSTPRLGTLWSFGKNVAVVPIEGEIFESRETIDMLRDYAESDSVRAIVVRINTPGGAIVPSQEIYSEILRLRRETGKPFVASMDSLAASGGYYIAVACDPIIANPGTITGSIGVITQWFNMEGLLQWARLEPQTVTSGEMKDAGSPFRRMSESDRAYLQQIVNRLHLQFIDAVAAGREGKLDREQVAALADGRVFTGEDALSLKLVDQIGTLHDAVLTAGRAAGIEGEPSVIYPRERTPGLLEILMNGESAARFVETVFNRKFAGTRILYRWY